MIYFITAFRNTLFTFFLFIAVKATAQPTISSFSPSSGPLGTSVSITGTNFNAVPANNIVYFGAVKATVTSGSTISLTVTVPAGATYQPISVLDNITGLTGYSSKPFITTFANPFGIGIPANFYKPKVDFAVGTNPRNIATGDADGDGKPDLVVANGNSNTLSVLGNTSSPGNITASSFASKVDFASGTFTEHVSIGDVDGDGKPDLVVVTNANISVLRNTSTPGSITASSFAPKVDFTSSSTGPVFGALGDVDGDGKPDIVTANPSANTVSVRRNMSTPGSISFATKIDFSTGGTPSCVAIGDVDGDGKLDLVTSNAAASANTVSVLRNTTTGTISFATKVDFATGPIPRSVAIGDVDGDGNPDLVVANNATSPSISTTISVLRNTSTPGSITASSFAAKVDFTAGSAPRSISIGDLDGDSKPDVVVANMNSNNISVLRNTSTLGSITASSFAATVDFPAGASPVSAVIVDVEGDGIPEIAVANGATSTSLGVSVFQINSADAPNAGTVSGTSPLCIGATATYTSNGDAGGTWSSTSPSIATVNATTGLVTAVSAGTTNITYTVSGVSSFKTLTVSPSVTAGTVSGTSPLNISGTATYTSNGIAGGTWSSTNTSVATVNTTTGFVTALSAGTTNITYTVSSGCGSPVSAFKTLTVNAANAGTVSGTSPLCIGATATYTSNGDAGGSWSSTNTSIATVNATTGFVTAVSAGTTDITYTVSGVSSFKTLTVSPNVSAGTVSGASPLCIGATATYNSNGTAGGAWSSTNTSVATVNATTGLVTAVSAGTTNITYTVSNGCGSPVSVFATLTVSPNVSAGTVSGTTPLCIGGTATYSSNGTSGGAWSSTNTSVATVNSTTGFVTAVAAGTTDITYTVASGCGNPVSSFKTLTVSPNVSAGTVSGTSPLNISATATYTSNGTAGGTWSSTNTSVATVNATTGLVTAVSAGTTSITYTVSSGCGSPVSSFKTLTVNPATNAGIVSGTSPLCIGVTATYTSNGDAGGTWSSTNTSIATVNATTGLVTAVNAGTTDITYTVSGISSFKTLTVSPNVSAGTVSGTSPLNISATATYTSNGTASGTWSSTNTSVATVNATTGLVTAVSAGTTNITYTVSSGCGSPVSAFKTLTVNTATNAGIVSGTSPLCIGATATYTSNGDAGGTWSSTNTSTATVNATTGLVTAVNAGTTDITYTVSGVSSFKTLTVSPNVSAGTVSGTSPLNISRTAIYTSNGTAGGTWSSTNTSVATVNATTGFVTAVGAGTTNITYTVSSGCGSPVSSFKTLTVNAATNAGIVSGTFPLCIGATATYTSNGDAGGSWSSTNTSVATVNATTGLVTAINAGTTDITYTVSGVSSFKTLTVSASVTPSVSIGASATTICAGSNVTFTATPTNGGTPAYQWKLNGDNVGTNSNTYLNNALTNGDIVTVAMTSSLACASPTTATSNATTMVVTASVTPSVTISADPANPICVGTNVTFTATPSNGGTPSYQWKLNGNNVSANSNTYSNNALANGDVVTVVMTSSLGCANPTTATSNTITMTANPNSSAGTISGASPLCIGQTSTYTSNGTSGGSWSSSNTSLATVNSSTGVVTALSAGTTNIVYTVTGSCSSVSASKMLTINPNVSAGVVSGATSLSVGAPALYTSTGTAGGSWTSTNNGIATVNTSTGLVTAVSTGTTNITYTVGSGCGSPVSAFQILTVMNNGGTVFCGPKDAKILICHNGMEICIAPAALLSHLDHGDIQGHCSTSKTTVIGENEPEKKLIVTTYPNPYETVFKLNIYSPLNGIATIEFYTISGVKIHEMKQNVIAGKSIATDIKALSSFTTSTVYKVSIGKYQTTGIIFRPQ